MTKYLVLYKADQSAQQQMAGATPDEAQAGMAAWMEWMQRAGDAVVDMGAPLTAADGSADPSLGGFSIMQADSDDALSKVMDGHPHLQLGTIETHRFLDMPGM